MGSSTDLALQHLALRLRPVNRALRAAVDHQARLAARLIRPDVTPLCVTDDQVHTLLEDVGALLDGTARNTTPASLTAEEAHAQEVLRSTAAAESTRLPLDQLAASLDLTLFEEEAVLLCAAPELDRSYERIYAYILDDLNRRHPCIELLCALTAGSLPEYVQRRHIVGRFGKLRRAGVLLAHGEPANELRQELRLSPGVFEYLTGSAHALANQFRDLAEIRVPAIAEIPAGVDEQSVRRLGRGLKEGWISVVGVWGPRQSGCRDAAVALAALASRSLRECSLIGAAPADGGIRLHDAVRTASALGTLLWLDADAFAEPAAGALGAACADVLTAANIPVILTGTHPWRPTPLLEARAYAELELVAPDCTTRQRMWTDALPEADAKQVHDLAARYRIGAPDVRAAARMGRTRARLAGNGHADELHDHLEAACAAVARKLSFRFATVVKPKRGPNDLVLPPKVHHQVLEVAQFFRVWPQVAEGWGFGHMETGAGGIKALFAGDSGTGKTLAAEVIAGQLGMPLLKVDLAQIVSKWVGETEKHLESAFREAEDSHAVLFFDEADALFGKRGEVQHGVDRYANLEVSYLLQRLEDHSGLVIVASNLKDNIDTAFTRRFQIVIHFPRPEPTERRRIWRIAFPAAAPLEDPADLDALSRLDLTGAGIVGAARTAALLAASEGNAVITKAHIARAIASQYRREARVLMPAELGSYAALVQEAK